MNQTSGTVAADDPKIRARSQWTGDPCGADTGNESEFGTRQFFDAVERFRYTEYAPWMPAVMGFDQFADARLLEVGCGMGTDLLQFARGGAHCTGMDLTRRSVEISRQRFSLYGESANFLSADGEELPFADNSFDVVYSNGVLHHTPETAKAISEIQRVLRPGGLAKVMLYHRHSFNYWVVVMLYHGLFRRHLLHGKTAEEIMSRVVEYSRSDARPLVKVYSRTEARRLFKPFTEIKLDVNQLLRQELHTLGHLLPEKLFGWLRETIGWNIIITAKK